MANSDYSLFRRDFWDQWGMKILRGLASVKYQWLLMLYVPVIWGLFNNNPTTKLPWISATEGLAFLSGAFLTLCGSRILANTKLTESKEDEGINTDK